MAETIDTDSLISQARQLLSRYQAAGGGNPDGHRPSLEERAAAIEVRDLADRIAAMLPTADADSLDTLVDLHDILYRMGYYRAPSTELHSAARQRFVNAWLHGDKRISATRVAALVAKQIHRNQDGVSQKMLDWYCRTMGDWCSQLSYADRFADIPPAENYNRLTIMLNENLWAYIPGDQTSAKRRWINANTVSDPSALSPAVRDAYDSFIQAAKAI